MDLNDRVKLYEKIYLFEIDRKEKLYSRLTLPSALTIAIISSLSLMLNQAIPLGMHCYMPIFWLLFVISVLLIGFSTFFLFFSITKRTDSLMQTAQEIETYHEGLNAHYWKPKKVDKKAVVDKTFNTLLKDSYIKCATINAANNKYRSDKLYDANRLIIWSLVFSVLTFTSLKIIVFNLTEEQKLATPQRPPLPVPPSTHDTKTEKPQAPKPR